MKHCPSCGAEVNSSRHYCPKCGAPLTEGTVGIEKGQKKATAALSCRIIIASLFILVVIVLVALLSHPNQFRTAKALAEEYASLIRTDKAEKLEALFFPELISRSSVEALDSWHGIFGNQFAQIGLYEATDSSGLNAELAAKIIRNDYGADISVNDYAQYLLGIVIDENDFWLQLDLIQVGKNWYLWQVK